ncbi:MAG: hypothetical protein B7Z78_00865 [Rhodospirillales bacterium 20-60-12]|nr:MAG: hypothetical protein B7Z78_00865 [Rhodospirillales bacterium 20-60-12]
MSMDVIDFSRSNACAGLSPADRAVLGEAAVKLLDARNVIVRIAESLGDLTSKMGGGAAQFLDDKFGIDVAGKIQEVTQTLLSHFMTGALTGMDAEGAGDRWGWLHKSIVMLSGATSGFVGLPGLLWDLPITTGNILRSVADISRAYPGENIDSEDTRRACIEIFAMGSPLADDDEADIGYWAARASLSHASVEFFIKTAAARFGVVISEKILAQAIPVAGAAAGAALNYAFMDYYQEMARIHFMIRGVERRTPDPSCVRPCFGEIVGALRQQRAR